MVEDFPQPNPDDSELKKISKPEQIAGSIGDANIVNDTTTAKERMKEREKEDAERVRELGEKLKSLGREDIIEEIRVADKDADSPEGRSRSRELLVVNIKSAQIEIMNGNYFGFEGSLAYIFEHANEKQVEHWILELIDGFDELNAPDRESRAKSLLAIKGLVNRNYFTKYAEKYLPEYGIDILKLSTPTPEEGSTIDALLEKSRKEDKRPLLRRVLGL